MENKSILKEILETPRPLSEEQKKAVLSESKYLRIVAGAGTGKTETLTRRIAYLLLYKAQEPASIVAFTFTERAAQGMKSRIYERVRQLKGEDACAKLGEMYVGTIHGYCLQILEDKFGYGDYDPLDENQEMAFILREGWGLGLTKDGGYSKNCGEFLRSVDVVYNELFSHENLGQKAPDFYRQFTKYEELLKRHRLITFGQMIALAVQKLETNPKILSNINHLIVDEYQDINRAQDRLIQLIGRNASTFIVGDPRQSIYQWRGSDERCFEEFLRNFPICEKVSIKENWRSVPAIVKAANGFAESFESTRYEPLAPTREQTSPVYVTDFDMPEDEAKWIARQIKELVEERKACRYPDIAILLRSVSTSAKPFLDIFRNEDIPYVVGGKIGLFQRDESQAVGRLFAWLYEWGFWKEGFFGEGGYMDGDDLLKSAIEKWRSVSKLRVESKDLSKALTIWKENVLNNAFKNFTSIYQELLITLGFLKLNPGDKLHAAIMANLGRFNTLLTDYETSIRLGGRKPDWQNTLKGLCWYMNTYATGAYEEQPTEDLRGIEAVQVMTIHQAKGLEWPVVFVPCLTARRFPTSRTGQKQHWHIPRDLEGFDVKRYEGGIEDEKRLFYVAITRAKDVLCLSHFKRLTNSQRPSQFFNVVNDLAKRIDQNKGIDSAHLITDTENDEIQAFSAGEIITYHRCPYLYCLREMWGYQSGLDTEIGYGKSLHYCLRCVSELIREGTNPEKAVRETVKEKFHLPFAGGRMLETMREAAENILTQFVKRHEQDMLRIQEVEARLEFPLEKATITGRVDVIIRGNDDKPSLEVRDYKTSDAVTTFKELCLQLQLYTLGLKKLERPVDSASVAYLDPKHKGNEIEPVPIHQDDLKAAEQEAENSIRGIRKASFPPKPGDHCKNACDFPQICKWSNA
ncbi:MAG: ATP-dependent helicase [Syntrophaceae bacterium]|nr:ATP-dependent helicase [Syntrophaceae bacterium]